MITAFDVIEHIQEDESVLSNFHRAIKPGGTGLITVPQHPRLWSSIDEESCHKRRYRSKELLVRLESAGSRIVRSTSFVTFLLHFLFLSRKSTGAIGKKVNDRALFLNPLLDRGGHVFGTPTNQTRFFIAPGGNGSWWPCEKMINLSKLVRNG